MPGPGICNKRVLAKIGLLCAAGLISPAGCRVNASAAGAYEPWSPDAVNITAPLTGGTPINLSTSTSAAGTKSPAYQDEGVENALDTGDYARAQSLINSKLSNSAGKGPFNEGYLRTALVESLIWQGQLPAAASEYKKLAKILDSLDGSGKSYTADDVKELRARSLDDQAWLFEAQGKLDDAQNSLAQAIVLLRELHAVDRQTWRLVGCMSHRAGLKAEAGDYSAAKQQLEDALAQVNGSHSISPLNVADIQENLGAVLFKLGDQKAAAVHFAISQTIKNASNALTQRYAPGPYWLSPTYKYRDGSAWSSKSFQNGVETKIMDLGAVTVQCAVVREKTTKQTLQVSISVLNKTNQKIEFMARPPVLIVLNPKATWARLIQPTDLASKVEKKADGKAKWIRFWGQNATQTVSSTSIGNMSMSGYGYGGGFPMYGYNGYNGFNGYNNNGYNNGRYKSNMDSFSNTMMSVPDPIAEARAFQKAQQVQDTGRAKADTIRAQSLGPSDIAAGQTINGNVFFDAGGLSKGSGCLVRIPIGMSQCEFRFDNIVDAP